MKPPIVQLVANRVAGRELSPVLKQRREKQRVASALLHVTLHRHPSPVCVRLVFLYTFVSLFHSLTSGKNHVSVALDEYGCSGASNANNLLSGAPCWQRRQLLASAPHKMLEFPSTLPPQPTRPNARRPSAERDLIPRHLGSRKMRRFINDNFIESEIEMHEGDDEPYEWKGTTFSNPAVLMMISEEEFVSEAKPRIRQACPTPVDRIERAGHARPLDAQR